MRVLVIEDDPIAARLVTRALEPDGYSVEVALTGGEGFALAKLHDYSLIVLDLGLQDRHGLSVLEDLRRMGRETPVLILTGEGAEAVMIRGFDAGADDFVTKPYSRDALRARVRALVRRSGAQHMGALAVGNLSLNRLAREARVNERALALTPREFALLEYLMLKQDEIVSRAELLEKVWDMHFDPGSNVVDAHVARVRKKLDNGGAAVEITTHRGVGFRIGPATAPPPR